MDMAAGLPDLNTWMVQVSQRLTALEKENSELREALALKADTAAVPTKEQFDQLRVATQTLPEQLCASLQLKADAGAVPTNEQFEQLRSTVAQKSFVDKVPTIEDMQNTQKMLDAATLQAKASDSQFQDVWSALSKKADAVPTVAQIQELRVSVEAKADRAGVPSTAQFQDLCSALAKKADADAVPTAAQLNELQVSVEAKADLGHIQTINNALENKADVSSIPSGSQLHELWAAIAQKADAGTVATSQHLLESSLESKAGRADLPSSAHFRELWTAMSMKADADALADTPSRKELQELRDELAGKDPEEQRKRARTGLGSWFASPARTTRGNLGQSDD